jgi:hypothetical protein
MDGDGIVCLFVLHEKKLTMQLLFFKENKNVKNKCICIKDRHTEHHECEMLPFIQNLGALQSFYLTRITKISFKISFEISYL